MSNKDQNGWNEYSRLVLQELERLSDNIDSLKGELQEVRQEIDEVASPTQLKELTNEVADLKTFKTKAVTVFVVVQFLMAAYAWAIKII